MKFIFYYSNENNQNEEITMFHRAYCYICFFKQVIAELRRQLAEKDATITTKDQELGTLRAQLVSRHHSILNNT